MRHHDQVACPGHYKPCTLLPATQTATATSTESLIIAGYSFRTRVGNTWQANEVAAVK